MVVGRLAERCMVSTYQVTIKGRVTVKISKTTKKILVISKESLIDLELFIVITVPFKDVMGHFLYVTTFYWF